MHSIVANENKKRQNLLNRCIMETQQTTLLFELINFENFNARQANYTNSIEGKQKQNDRLVGTKKGQLQLPSRG